jgi:hypothetical protein
MYFVTSSKVRPLWLQCGVTGVNTGILSLEEGLHTDEGLEIGDNRLGQAWSRAAHSRVHLISSWSAFLC